jgi:CYTH domain-containing protein
MAQEIERKLLVAEPPAELEGGRWNATRIEQGYVAITDAAEVRVRRADVRDAVLTIKSAPGLARTEVELAITPEQFAQLWPLTEGRRLIKVRYAREEAPGVVLELDVYDGDLQGLAVLEVEFASEEAAAAWTPPDWAGPEVTGDKAYANQTLAVRGRPS